MLKASIQDKLTKNFIAALRDGNKTAMENFLNNAEKISIGSETLLNVITKGGFTPLHIAMEGTNDDILAFIANHHMTNLDYKDSDGNNYMHYAMNYSNETLIRILLEKKPELLNTENQKKETPFQYVKELYGTDFLSNIESTIQKINFNLQRPKIS